MVLKREALVAATRAALPSHVPGARRDRGALDLPGARFYLERVLGAGADALLALLATWRRRSTGVLRGTGEASGEHAAARLQLPGRLCSRHPRRCLGRPPGTGREKDSSGDPDRLIESKARFDEPIYTGAASLLTLAGGIGSAGDPRAGRAASPRSASPPSRVTAAPKPLSPSPTDEAK